MITRKLPGIFFFLLFPCTLFGQDEIGDSENKYFNKRWDTLSVTERKIPVDILKRLKEDKDFWYMDSTSVLSRAARRADEALKKGKTGDEEKDREVVNDQYVPVSHRPWFQVILWVVIVGGFAVFLAIYLAGSNIGLFRKKNQRRGNADEEGPMPEDIFAINYQREIDKAVEQENYRLAVRLHFLRLLKNMADRDLIRYKQDKTNFDYLMELANTTHYTEFFRATRNYEYSWYGLFPVSSEAYRTIKKDFDILERQLA